MKKNFKNIFLVLYVVALIASTVFPLYHFIELASIAVIVRFGFLFSYYIFSSKKINYTFIFLIFLNVVGDLIYIQTSFDSFLISLGIFTVINLLLSFIIYKYYITVTSYSFSVFLTPFLTFIILIGYISFALLERTDFLFAFYGLSFVLLIVNGVLYYINRLKKASFWMLLGIVFLMVSATFTAMDKLLMENEYYHALDTVFYGVALFLIAKSVVFEDEQSLNLKFTSN